jgi:hypothetical protein
MTFLRHYGYGATGYTLLVSALVVQWSAPLQVRVSQPRAGPGVWARANLPSQNTRAHTLQVWFENAASLRSVRPRHAQRGRPGALLAGGIG